MRLDGPTSDRDPKIDFSEWEWGDLIDLRVVYDRVAELLWSEIIDSLDKPDDPTGPRFILDEDNNGAPSLQICLLDTHFLIIPLSEIRIGDEDNDEDEDWSELTVDKSPYPNLVIDWERSIQLKRQAIETLQKWITTLQKAIDFDQKEAHYREAQGA